ncbi:unnamed protein product [Rotaria socialis]
MRIVIGQAVTQGVGSTCFPLFARTFVRAIDKWLQLKASARLVSLGSLELSFVALTKWLQLKASARLVSLGSLELSFVPLTNGNSATCNGLQLKASARLVSLGSLELSFVALTKWLQLKASARLCFPPFAALTNTSLILL